MPSKLATSAAGGRVPGAVCSMSFALTPKAIVDAIVNAASNHAARLPRKRETTKPKIFFRVFVAIVAPGHRHQIAV